MYQPKIGTQTILILILTGVLATKLNEVKFFFGK